MPEPTEDNHDKLHFGNCTLEFVNMFCVNKKCLQITLSLFITGACLTFVSFQSKKCISKYINNPQGTKLSLQNAGTIHHFPAITICDHITLDDGQLKRCGIRYDSEYFTYS